MVLFGAHCPDARHRAYDLLALAIKQEWGLSQLPSIERRNGGKPYFPARPDLEFNLSHSGSLLLCGLDVAPLGVDIQVIKSLRPGLPARVCSSLELDWLGDGADLWTRFAQLWACKEAYVKYTGDGLTRSIAGIQVPLPIPENSPIFFHGLWFRVFLGNGWAGAVCGESLPPTQIVHLPLGTTLP